MLNLKPVYTDLPNIGAYTIAVSKCAPKGSSLAKTGLFCCTFVKFSAPKYTSNLLENTLVICAFNN